MYKVLLIGGDFGETPRRSGYLAKLADAMETLGASESLIEVDLINGGTLDTLAAMLTRDDMWRFDALLWFPNIANTEDKFLTEAKRVAAQTHMVFVSSKRNLLIDGVPEYQPLDIVGRAIFSQSNLLLEFRRKVNSREISATLWDPLGNAYCHCTTEINRVAYALNQRIAVLAGSERYPSVFDPSISGVMHANHEQFMAYCRNYASLFHELIHAANPSRFLGNVAFRCERGFPAMRNTNGTCFVSQRNVDKRGITSDEMLPVKLFGTGPARSVHYGGESNRQKPSVDAPIQIRLFDALPHINYILHSHVYVAGGLFTQRRLPCGDGREVEDVLSRVAPSARYAAINLLGHGSLVLGTDPEIFADIHYTARPLPELAQEYDAFF